MLCVIDAMELVDVDVVGLEPLEAQGEVLLCVFTCPCACFGRDDHLVPAPSHSLPYSLLARGVAVSGIDVSDAKIKTALDHGDGVFLCISLNRNPAETKSGDHKAGAAQFHLF